MDAVGSDGLTLRTSRRDIFLLACCQALLLVNSSGLTSMNGLIGFSIAQTKALSTFGATTYVLGSALAAMPMSMWMAKVGRRAGFMTGAAVNIVGCVIGVLALHLGSFPLFCAATGIIGVYNAVGLQYRFAAAEVAAPADRARAISLVLAGGVAGGFIGPQTAKLTKDLFATPFQGSFAALAVVALAALAVQSRVQVPPPSHAERAGGGRSLATIMRQPTFIVAALAAALGYGLMNLLMTATPIAMDFCGHPFSAAALVIEWHVVAMYAPGFVTGNLIKRFGALRIILVGVALMAIAVAIALNGTSVAHFVAALAFVGAGWNFMYTGGTTLLTETYAPAERARTQGINDFIVFATMGVSSLASGALVTTRGWDTMNRAALPVLAVIAAAALWLAWLRRRAPAAPA
ncbi:MAG: MFS transporter [Betaproteobacteria bacterium]|nr:MFS transporter [Betaproteobacteria bacterium]